LLPMVAETVYRGLTGERSVHLADWPDPLSLPDDLGLVVQMDTVREVCSAGHSVRKANDLRARLPVADVTVAGAGAPDLEPYRGLIEDELNVKHVRLVSEVDEVADLVLHVAPSVCGPRLGPATQQVIAAVRRGEWTRLADGGVEAAGHVLVEGEYFLSLVPKDAASARALPGHEMVVSLSLERTPELDREGLARDVVRQVQEARKRAGFDVTDRIRLVLYVSHFAELRRAVEEYTTMISGETLADEVVLAEEPTADAERATVADGRVFHLRVVRVAGGQ
jgi:isoleucyl-tRNA synthetase